MYFFCVNICVILYWNRCYIESSDNDTLSVSEINILHYKLNDNPITLSGNGFYPYNLLVQCLDEANEFAGRKCQPYFNSTANQFLCDPIAYNGKFCEF